jgi:4-methylaminobutanoate oxidase (formaldehyde-forming)
MTPLLRAVGLTKHFQVRHGVVFGRGKGGVGRTTVSAALGALLAQRGACFGEVAGWARANWFATDGMNAGYEYSYKRQNWFRCTAAEHNAVRNGVAALDQSSFAKFLVEGRDSEAVLQRISANDVAVADGKIVYTQWLNDRGGIEADLTVTRLSATKFMAVTSAACAVRDFDWLRSHIPDGAHAVAVDMTSAFAVLSVMGPQSRALLASVSGEDLSSAAFPFGTSREIEIGYAKVRASRITYVGELGWELYIPTEFARNVFAAVARAGEGFGLKFAGMHAMDSCRMEKAYRSWGHDISDEDTPLEAGLGFVVKLGKGIDFIGREALLRQRETRLTKRLVQVALDDPEPLLYHNEPIWRDGKLVGRTTSGAYGHHLGRAIALGYLHDDAGVDAEYVRSGRYEIEVAGVRHAAKASLEPLYDPKSLRIRA